MQTDELVLPVGGFDTENVETKFFKSKFFQEFHYKFSEKIPIKLLSVSPAHRHILFAFSSLSSHSKGERFGGNKFSICLALLFLRGINAN